MSAVNAVAGAVHDVVVEGALEHHDAWSVGECTDQLGLQCAAIGVAIASAE